MWARSEGAWAPLGADGAETEVKSQGFISFRKIRRATSERHRRVDGKGGEVISAIVKGPRMPAAGRTAAHARGAGVREASGKETARRAETGGAAVAMGIWRPRVRC